MSDHSQIVILPVRRSLGEGGSIAKDPFAVRAASHGFFAMFRMTVSQMPRLPALAASGLIWLYQRTLSPALVVLNPGCGCRFTPTCSHYARGALLTHGLAAGTCLTVRRLAKCGPWHPGGEDPVPLAPARFNCTRIARASSPQA